MAKKLLSERQAAALGRIISRLQEPEEADKQFQRCLKGLNVFTTALQAQYGSIGELIKACLEFQEQPDAYLTKILGSRSRASELLTGKRTPSLADIKSLKTHLGIPADLLIAAPKETPEDIDYERFPVAEMVKRGWVSKELKKKPKEAVEYLCQQSGTGVVNAYSVCLRQGPRKNSKSDPYALHAWLLGVQIAAHRITVDKKFTKKIASKLLDTVVHALSPTSRGVGKAQKFLAERGIKFVVLPHFKGTHLDGAVFFDSDKTPVVALTGRYDRLDNFWFTLLHELAHIVLGHVTPDSDVIFDDLDIVPHEAQEAEADRLARESAIPEERWQEFPLEECSHSDIYDLALDLGISPAIVAGRVRFETKNYRSFTSLVGHGEIRKHFSEVFVS